VIKQSAQRTSSWSPWAVVFVALAVLVGVVVIVVAGFNSVQPTHIAPEAVVSSGATQTSEGGQVTIKATWQGPGAGLIFDVVMDTHAVDLDGYDLAQLAALRIDGAREIHPASWDAPKGGHHRQGKLTFPSTVGDGSPLITADTRTIELVIRDVAGVPERVLRWTP
jgi:hypothetical protein